MNVAFLNFRCLRHPGAAGAGVPEPYAAAVTCERRLAGTSKRPP
jgi:hypothetical protein